MTAQISDVIIYENERYDITGLTNDIPFILESYGLAPVGKSSGCYRGFQRIFIVQENQLQISGLNLNENLTPENMESPVIFGIKPVSGKRKTRSLMFNKKYTDLNSLIEYSGAILIGKDFIHELYTHMGFHPAWKYKKVIELTFEKGILTSISDLTEKIEEKQRGFTNNEEMMKRLKPDKWIEDSFNQKYMK